MLTRLKARGLFEADEDFPDDEEEIWWFVGQGGEVSKETEVTETTGVKVKDKAPDKNMVMALTSDEGPLAAGAVPKIGNMCETGEKNLYESLNKHTAAPKKRARQPRTSEEEPKAEEMIPKTPKDQVKEMKEGVLTNATAARKYALSLKHLNYSGELVQGLMNFSQKMESLFDKITELLNNPSAGDDRFIKIKSYIERNAEWYTQAEARCSQCACLHRIILFIPSFNTIGPFHNHNYPPRVFTCFQMIKLPSRPIHMQPPFPT